MNPAELRARAARARAVAPPAPPSRPSRQGPPPEDRGRRLLTLAREERGRRAELRVSWDEYGGRSFLNVRLWTFDDEGGAWPTKKGASFRPAELADLATAIADAIDIADDEATKAGR